MVHLLEEEGLADRVRVDSAGTGAYHVGEPPDPRSVAVARENGVPLRGTARQVVPSDFRHFSRVVAMDRDNLRKLERIAAGEGGGARLHLFREFDPEAGEGAEVPDPYYGGPRGFQEVYEMVERGCRVLVEELRRELEGRAGGG